MKSQFMAPFSSCLTYTRKQLIKLRLTEHHSRCNATYANSDENRRTRNELFDQEQKRQRAEIGRIEKIEVNYVGVPEDKTLVMNKWISTPFHCAQHMQEMLVRRSALALVDGKRLWDIHRPLEDSCQLRLLHFKDDDPRHVNRAFWRTCSLMLGAVAESCFKDNVDVKLHSFPSPNVKSGSFTYDVTLDLENWQPTKDELRVLSSQFVNLSQRNLPVERLTVSEDKALEMFADNPHKTKQIPSIAGDSEDGKVTLYRIGDHIDISRGPMVGNTNFLGRCTITAVHQVETEDAGKLYRFQGVALPTGFLLNHFAYGILEDRAKKLNVAHATKPHRSEETSEMDPSVQQAVNA